MTKLFSLAAGIVLMLSVAVASSPAAPPPHQIDTALTATATFVDVHSGFAVCWDLRGTGIIPAVGRVDFTGFYCQIFIDSAPWGGRSYPFVTIDFTAANGDTFTIQTGEPVLHDPNHDPSVQPWTVTAATGRFADLSGSGSYTAEWSAPTEFNVPTPLIVSFSGTLAH